MKIDPQLNLPGAQSTAITGADPAVNGAPLKVSNDRSKSQGADQASLSPDAVQLSNLRAKLSSVPEIRQDRVATLSAAIKNGTYSVSNRQIAEALLRDFQTGPSSKG